VLGARGESREIFTLWDKMVFEVSLVHRNFGKKVYIFNVHASVQYNEKIIFWQGLCEIMDSNYDKNSIVAGNFNMVLLDKESGGSIV
jgi:endonuclease/exonuclease/phosphatase family metal-dependent hydrolase